MKKYFGSFDSYDNTLENFMEYGGYSGTRQGLIGIVPEPNQVLFASYGGAAWEGDAIVIFRIDGKLYEVRGSHCSCMGLEGQWEPEETTVAALEMRSKKDGKNYYYFLSDHTEEAYDAYWRLIETLKKEN